MKTKSTFKMIQTTNIKSGLLGCNLIACLSLLGSVVAAPTLPKTRSDFEDRGHMVQFRHAGLHADRSQVAEMTKLLLEPDYAGYTVTLLHALAQLGETSALPVIDKRMEREKDITLSHYGVAERARLVAEADAKSLSGRDRASVQVRRFLEELGLSADDINGSVTTYETSLTYWKASNPPEDSLPPPAPIQLFAMRELADMAYHGVYSDYVAQPQFARINFSLDNASGLKARLAALTTQARVNTMVNEISREVTGSLNDKYEMQLLVDEGTLAAQAITARKQEISQHPKDYKGQWGMIAGVSLLNVVLEQVTAPAPSNGHSQTNQPTAVLRHEFVAGY